MKIKHTFIMVFESDELDASDLEIVKDKFKDLGITNLSYILVPAGTNVKLFDLYTAHDEGELDIPK